MPSPLDIANAWAEYHSRRPAPSESDLILRRTKARISHTERAWELLGDLATLTRVEAAKRLTEALTAAYDRGTADAR